MSLNLKFSHLYLTQVINWCYVISFWNVLFDNILKGRIRVSEKGGVEVSYCYCK